MTSGTRARAILLAAGQGKRMNSSLPKVLHEVLGRTILARVLAALDGLALEHLHIVVGFGAAPVRQFLDANPPRTPWSVHLQEPQLGTGHAVMQVAPALSSFQGTLLTTVGDTPLLTTETLRSLLARHRETEATVSLLTTQVDDSRSYGRIVRDRQGQVTRIVEDKDATEEERQIKEINPAIYCLSWPEVKGGLAGLSKDNRQGEYYLTDLIGWAVNERLPVASSLAPDWREVSGINSRLELAEANRLLKERVIARLALECGVTIVDPQSTWIAPEVSLGRDSVVYPGCYLVGQVEIGESCSIGPHTVMYGPVRVGKSSTVTQSLITNSTIGSGCRVGPFAHLRERAELSDQVRVGNFVEVKASQIGDHTNASHLSYVGDATIGAGANIGAGTITANYDHIAKTKARTIIGDGSSTGSNSVLVAPVVLGKDVVVAAGSVVTRDVPDGALAVGRARQEIKPGWTQAKRRKLER